MELIGRACCWIAAVSCFVVAASLPCFSLYLEANGPPWLMAHAKLCDVRQVISNVELSLMFCGIGLVLSGIYLISQALGDKRSNGRPAV